MRDSAEDFAGTDRFLVQRRIGSGAFGVVYQAYDRREGARVALKVLRTAEADALYRFKNDFRSLADLRHPNLVSLYELFTEGELWFFSMELLHGVDFLEYLLGPESLSETPEPERIPDDGSIRRVAGQLAHGLHAVHQGGMVHRDVKPSNVLVTSAPGDERAVLLDFGLVAELRPSIPGNLEAQLIGTPAYMSPEQALALPGTAAGDWYSFGVMLFQALTGELPFQGSMTDILTAKQIRKAPSPRELRPSVPADLEELCRGLLEPDPEVRLSGGEVLRRLGGEGSATIAVPPMSEALFIGRRRLLADLADALTASRSGAVAVHLRGESGIGKTALIQRFARDVRERDDRAVALSGRCYVQESVPYKALDNLIDNLARFLLTLPREEAAGLLAPGDRSATTPSAGAAELARRDGAAELARLFPVLRRVPAIDDAAALPGIAASDPRRIRRRAFTALRRILARLAAARPLMLVIDDLQWGDVDSFRLLDEIFKGSEPPSLLLIASYRSEDRATSPSLRALEEHREGLRWRGVDVRDVRLERLSPRESRELLRVLGDRGCRVAEDRVADLVREAAGSPLFLYELALGGVRPTGARPTGVRLRDVIFERARELGETALRLLEVVAVAGQPLELETVRQAAGLPAGSAEAVARLRSQRLIRQLATPGGAEVETYHDAIREAVLRSLDARSLRGIHKRLAVALESSGRADPETLAVHFQATEEVERARVYAASAAERAEKALAFERAARLYRQALDLSADAAESYRLQIRLGSALANAGRSWEAAETYLRAVRGDAGRRGAAGGPASDPLDVQRRAAEKLLISGHIDRGLAVLRHVLRRAGMGLDDRRWKARLSLWFHRLRLRWRGWGFRERTEASCDPEALARIDICWSVEIGLCLVDVLHASLFHARHLRMALDMGDPPRIARGLAMEIFFGTMGGADGRRASAAAGRLAGRLEDRYPAGLLEMATGMAACSQGRWEVADERLTEAEELLREVRTGGAWDLDTVRHFQVIARLGLGRWRELFADLPGLLEPAQAQGNLCLEIHLRHWVESLRDLADDRPERALSLLDATIARWSHGGFHYQHFGHLYARVEVELYRGAGRKAWALLRDRWQELVESMIQKIEMVRIQSYDLRGRTALAAAVDPETGPRRRARLAARAEADAHRLEHGETSWPRALAKVLRAGAENVRVATGRIGRDRVATDRVRELLVQASGLLEETAMEVHATIIRRRLAELDGTAGGVVAVDRKLRELGIGDPARFAGVLAPGFERDPPGSADPPRTREQHSASPSHRIAPV